MANPEHLTILKQGVERWNKWRDESGVIWPDLSRANLGGPDLRGVDFSNVELNDADFSMAALLQANLHRANLTSALQHGTAAFVAGIQTTSAASHLAEGDGAWRYGKRCAFPTSPHPRR
jgi:uncharacterized protein YjbI with pentapeptide repeats